MHKKVLGIIFIVLLLGCEESKTIENEIVTDRERLKNIICETMQEQQQVKITEPVVNKSFIGINEANQLKEKVDSIMGKVGKGDLDLAFNEIKEYTWISDKEIDIVYKGTEKQLKFLGNRYGAFEGYEFVSQKNISKSLVQFIYIAKCANHPLIWEFSFYKAKDKWTLNEFFWHDKIKNIRY